MTHEGSHPLRQTADTAAALPYEDLPCCCACFHDRIRAGHQTVDGHSRLQSGRCRPQRSPLSPKIAAGSQGHPPTPLRPGTTEHRTRPPIKTRSRLRPHRGDPSTTLVIAATTIAGERWAATESGERRQILHAVADASSRVADHLPIAQDESHLPWPWLTGERPAPHSRSFSPTPPRQASTLTFVSITPTTVADGRSAAGSVPHVGPGPGPRLGAPSSHSRSAPPAATPLGTAAGCPVIYKAHHGHPALSDATATVVNDALDTAGAPAGLFSTIHSSWRRPRRARPPRPQGRRIHRRNTRRPSTFRHRTGTSQNRSRSTVNSAASIRCSSPSPRPPPGAQGDRRLRVVHARAGAVLHQTRILLVPADSAILTCCAMPRCRPDMLNAGIARGHSKGARRAHRPPGVQLLTGGGPETDPPAPTFASHRQCHADHRLRRSVVRCFGPTALVVTYADTSDLLRIARRLHRSAHRNPVAEPDDAIVGPLTTILTRKAGRILWNQWPTGVSATYAQQHGGPYPAEHHTRHHLGRNRRIEPFRAGSGMKAIPQQLLPGDQSVNSAPRRVNGVHDRHTPMRDIASTTPSTHTPRACDPSHRQQRHRDRPGGNRHCRHRTDHHPATGHPGRARLSGSGRRIRVRRCVISQTYHRPAAHNGVSIASMSSSAVVLRSARQIATVPSIDATQASPSAAR